MNEKGTVHQFITKEGLEILREVFDDQGKVVIEEWLNKFSRVTCLPYMRVLPGGKNETNS